MMEQELTRIENEIKALKSSLPVSGSLVDTFCITRKVTKTLQNEAPYQYTVTFTPDQEYGKKGLATLSIYEEEWASGPYTSQYNPYAFGSSHTSRQQSDGTITVTVGDTPYFYDGDTFDLKLTVSVYGTIPGDLSITWS